MIASHGTRNSLDDKYVKVGMSREAHSRQDVYQKGEWHDSYL